MHPESFVFKDTIGTEPGVSNETLPYWLSAEWDSLHLL